MSLRSSRRERAWFALLPTHRVGPLLTVLISIPAIAQQQSEIIAEYPGARVALRETQCAPAPAAPENAADAWARENLDSFARAGIGLRKVRSTTIAAGRLTVSAYEFEIDGLTVEDAAARIVVSNDCGGAVVLATATRTFVPPDRSVAQELDAATIAAKAAATVGEVPAGETPERCWLRDSETGVAQRAWKIAVSGHASERQTAYLDAQSGALLRLRDDVMHIEQDGSVYGLATPGMRPDQPANGPAVVGLPAIRVWATSGANTHTDPAGDFVLPAQAPGTIVSSSLTSGQFVAVSNAAGLPLAGSAFVFPGFPADLFLNPATDEFLTAQVNAYRHTALAHDFFRARSNFAAIDVVVPVNVNMVGLCNASFDGGALNFYRSAAGCYNSAYSTIVAHEYAHFIVAQLGLGQGAFGEGFADALAMLLYDTPTIGDDFYRGSAMRHPGSAGRQYPCSGEIHYCGEVLAGVWWDLAQNLAASGGQAGREAARQLFVDWAQITLGGGGVNLAESAHPLTAIEVLTVDDDDNDLQNGTPHYSEICAAFSAHGIACPGLSELRFSYPGGLPDWRPPGEGYTVRFRVEPAQSIPLRNSGLVLYTDAGGSWQMLAAVETAPNEYACTLPAMTCGQTMRYRVSARTTLGAPVNHPSSGAHATTAALRIADIFADDCETDGGWSSAAPGDTATLGRWERAIPQATAAQPGADHSALGAMCWVTQAAAGSSTSSFDVDNGRTTLTSPPVNASAAGDALCSYWRWYSNHAVSSAPHADVFEVFVSNDGANWIRVETVGPEGPETSGGWFFRQFRLSDFVPPSASVQLRFVASDLNESSTVEAAVDDVRISAFLCDQASGCDPGCPEDIDFDCMVSIRDLALLLSHFGETNQGSAADIQGDGRVDIADLVFLLSAFGTSCQ